MSSKRWDDIKAGDPDLDTGEYRAAYAQARHDLMLGMRVRELREAAGLSQSELARRTGTRQPNIARLEAGGGIPKLETLQRVADALNMELEVSFRPAKRRRSTGKTSSATRAMQIPAPRVSANIPVATGARAATKTAKSSAVRTGTITKSTSTRKATAKTQPATTVAKASGRSTAKATGGKIMAGSARATAAKNPAKPTKTAVAKGRNTDTS